MNLEVVKLAAADKSWATIFPELMLGCIALGLLVLEILLPKKYHAVIPDFALAGLLARVSRAQQRMPRVEFYPLVLVITAAMMLLAQANHFVLLFVALETVTIGFYILVSYFRTNPLSLEAGLKYLVMGALSSGLLLFGIVLLYGVAGNPTLPAHTANAMHYGALATFLAANPHHFLARNVA